MNTKVRKMALLCLLAAVLGMLCSCKVNPSEEQLFEKLLSYFHQQGHAVSVQKLEEGMRTVPIYNSSVWYSMLVDGEEEVLVYFDESNRADYLADGIDLTQYSCVTRFGLRFVLVYSGENGKLLQTLEAIPEF